MNAASSKKIDIEINEMDYCSMLYTSGTTGHPKGVLHRHREMAEHSMICTYFLKYNRDSVGLVCTFISLR